MLAVADIGKATVIAVIIPAAALSLNNANGKIQRAQSTMRKTTTGRMTKVVLLISFIILVGRLLYAAVVAVPHHQEKKLAPQQSTTEMSDENRDITP